MKKLLALLIILPVFASAKTHVEIALENSASVVAVNVMRKDGVFTGTGFVVGSYGLIATNKHVVKDAVYLSVTFNTGAESGEANVVAVGEEADIALMQITARDLPAVVLGDSDYVLPGSVITVIGNPRRLQNTVTNGLVSQIRAVSKDLILHQISAPISPSSSGSPVFNEKGEVISVATSTYKGDNNQNLNFAVPVNYLKELMLKNGFAPKEPVVETLSRWDRVKNYFADCWNIFKRIFKR